MAKRGRKKSARTATSLVEAQEAGRKTPPGPPNPRDISKMDTNNNNNNNASNIDSGKVSWSIAYLDEELRNGNFGRSIQLPPASKRRKISTDDDDGAEDMREESTQDLKALAENLGYTLDKSPYVLPAGVFGKSKDKFGGGGDASLDRWYKVLPKEWDDVPSYESFEWQHKRYEIGDHIDVQGEGMRYIGRIIEIRAHDEKDVKLLVTWLYFPQEVPDVDQLLEGGGSKAVKGKQDYHGKHELLLSNHMDIIPAYSVNWPVTVIPWDENNSDYDPAGTGTWYWRQGFDLKTRHLSILKLLCSCKRPENPDLAMVQCSNRKCAEWLHKECVEKDAKQKAAITAPIGRTRRHHRQGTSRQHDGTVVTAGLVISDGEVAPKLVMKRQKKGSSEVLEEWESPVSCLVCGMEIV